MRLSLKHYTVSSMLCLTDKILSFPFLKICMDSYIQDYKCEGDEDMFLNPGIMEHKVIFSVKVDFKTTPCCKDVCWNK